MQGERGLPARSLRTRGALQKRSRSDSASRGTTQTILVSAVKRFRPGILSLPDVTTRWRHCHVLSPEGHF